MRLHGRNATKWWRHDTVEERYDYLYSRDELKPFAETADAAHRLVKKLYLYLNNHFAAKAVANAAILKHQLGMPVAGDYPPQFWPAIQNWRESSPCQSDHCCSPLLDPRGPGTHESASFPTRVTPICGHAALIAHRLHNG